MEEIWKGIEGFECYKVSNYGSVKSLKYGKERILKYSIDGDGYRHVILMNSGKSYIRKIHILVSESFLGHKSGGFKLVVNHKDFNRTNNNVENLEIISQRENANLKHIKSSSKYTGVAWCKARQKWVARIFIHKRNKNLGYFINEYDAHLAYEKELINLK